MKTHSFHKKAKLLAVGLALLPTIGHTQEAQTQETQTLKIPRLERTITLPKTWVIANEKMLQAASNKIQFENLQKKERIERIQGDVGKNFIVALAHREPSKEWNAGVFVAWKTLPTHFSSLPNEEKKRRLLETAQKALTLHSAEGTEILSGPQSIPKVIGATIETARMTTLSNGEKGKFITNTFFLIDGSILLTLSRTYEAREENQYKNILSSILKSVPLSKNVRE